LCPRPLLGGKPRKLEHAHNPRGHAPSIALQGSAASAWLRLRAGLYTSPDICLYFFKKMAHTHMQYAHTAIKSIAFKKIQFRLYAKLPHLYCGFTSRRI